MPGTITESVTSLATNQKIFLLVCTIDFKIY